MTRLGTPLSPQATRVMLLGSGELGKEVLIALQRLGVETIAVDRYENAPGQQVAHHARTIVMSDPAQLRALIEQEKPDLVVPEIEAIATPVLEALEAAGTVKVIPTARAARLTMDREGIRRLAAETLGLPTSPYRFCDSLEELQAAIDRRQKQFNRSCLHRRFDVLLEKPGRHPGQVTGRSPYLQAVNVQADPSRIGEIAPVRITDIGPNSLFGVIEEPLYEGLLPLAAGA